MDRRSFPTTTDTRKMVRAVDAATDISESMDWTAALTHMPTNANNSTQLRDFKRRNLDSIRSKETLRHPPTCPAFRAQMANFALTLEMLATSFQLIWTAVAETLLTKKTHHHK